MTGSRGAGLGSRPGRTVRRCNCWNVCRSGPSPAEAADQSSADGWRLRPVYPTGPTGGRGRGVRHWLVMLRAHVGPWRSVSRGAVQWRHEPSVFLCPTAWLSGGGGAQRCLLPASASASFIFEAGLEGWVGFGCWLGAGTARGVFESGGEGQQPAVICECLSTCGRSKVKSLIPSRGSEIGTDTVLHTPHEMEGSRY